MTSALTGLTLHVTDEQADPEELEELTGRLRRELLDLDVEAVDRVRAGTPPPGTRAVDVAAAGALVVTVAQSPVIVAIVAAVRTWLTGSSRRSVKIAIGGDVIELVGQSTAEQRRLIDEWLARRSGE